MKAINRTCLMVLILVLGISCTSTKQTVSTKTDKYGLTVDKKWLKFLEKSQAVVKKTINDYQQSLLDELGDDAAAYWSKDVNKMEAIPVAVYMIDSVAFSTIDENTDYTSILKLYKGSAKYYFLENGEFINSVVMNYQNGCWVRNGSFGSCISFDKNFENNLKYILFEKKLRYITIFINAFSMLYFNAFIDESGKFMLINEAGQIWPMKRILLGYKEGCYASPTKQ